MNKEKLIELALGYAKGGRSAMIASHGSEPQRAVIVDHHGKHSMIVFGEVVHGRRFASVVRTMVDKIGGPDAVDAILVQADARLKPMSKAEYDARVPSDHDIADDPANPEVLITCARSYEHQILINDFYQRRSAPGGDVIWFDAPEPVASTSERGLVINMIPDVWAKVN